MEVIFEVRSTLNGASSITFEKRFKLKALPSRGKELYFVEKVPAEMLGKVTPGVVLNVLEEQRPARVTLGANMDYDSLRRCLEANDWKEASG